MPVFPTFLPRSLPELGCPAVPPASLSLSFLLTCPRQGHQLLPSSPIRTDKSSCSAANYDFSRERKLGGSFLTAGKAIFLMSREMSAKAMVACCSLTFLAARMRPISPRTSPER